MPPHKGMETSQPANHIGAGAQIEMIGIGEDHRRAQFL